MQLRKVTFTARGHHSSLYGYNYMNFQFRSLSISNKLIAPRFRCSFCDLRSQLYEISLFVTLPIYPFQKGNLRPETVPSLFWSKTTTIYLSVCLFACLYLSSCLSVCLSAGITIFTQIIQYHINVNILTFMFNSTL